MPSRLPSRTMPWPADSAQPCWNLLEERGIHPSSPLLRFGVKDAYVMHATQAEQHRMNGFRRSIYLHGVPQRFPWMVSSEKVRIAGSMKVVFYHGDSCSAIRRARSVRTITACTSSILLCASFYRLRFLAPIWRLFRRCLPAPLEIGFSRPIQHPGCRAAALHLLSDGGGAAAVS